MDELTRLWTFISEHPVLAGAALIWTIFCAYAFRGDGGGSGLFGGDGDGGGDGGD